MPHYTIVMNSSSSRHLSLSTMSIYIHMKDGEPMLNAVQLKQYFELISFEYLFAEPLKPTLELLRELHEKHVFSIPFENLSIHFNEHIHIDLQWIFEKFTRQPQRGGYCHEMNGLFYEVLKTLGFDVQLYLADVIIAQDTFRCVPDPGHAMLIVCIGAQRYLVDVGFGLNGLIHPLLLEQTDPQQIYGTTFQIVSEGNGTYRFGVYYNGQFHPEYRFNFSNPIEDIRLLQCESDRASYEDVVFKTLTLITKPTRSGRMTLSYKQLRIIDEKGIHKELIPNINQFYIKLREHFGMALRETEKELFERKMHVLHGVNGPSDSRLDPTIPTPLQIHSHFSERKGSAPEEHQKSIKNVA